MFRFCFLSFDWYYAHIAERNLNINLFLEFRIETRNVHRETHCRVLLRRIGFSFWCFASRSDRGRWRREFSSFSDQSTVSARFSRFSLSPNQKAKVFFSVVAADAEREWEISWFIELFRFMFVSGSEWHNDISLDQRFGAFKHFCGTETISIFVDN